MSPKESLEEPQPTTAKELRPTRMAQGLRASVVAGPDAGARVASFSLRSESFAARARR